MGDEDIRRRRPKRNTNFRPSEPAVTEDTTSKSPEPRSDDRLVLDYRNPNASCLRRALGLVFSFIMIHYLFWGMLMFGLLVFLCYQGPLGMFVAGCLFLLYIPTYIAPVQHKLGRPWDFLRKLWFWKLTQEYLDLRLIRTTKLDPSRNYIMAYHPHGIIILSRVATYGGAWEAMFPNMPQRTLGASPMFYVPGVRDLSLWLGAVDASRASAEKVLSSGMNLLVYPGGSKEIFHTKPASKKTVLVLRSRRGFIKLALKYGTPLVPVFVFGEKWRYSRFIFPESWVKFCLQKLRMPLLLFWGRFGTLLPLRHKVGLSVVYGEPIEVEKVEGDATDDQIAAVQEKYIAAVQALYDDNKDEMGYDADETLEIQ